MPNSRLDAFRAMVEKNPGNPLARFGLANEALKAEQYEEAVEQLTAYLGLYDDEGNAYGRLALALEKLGRVEEAKSALRTGIETANRRGHPGMANEFELKLDELDSN